MKLIKVLIAAGVVMVVGVSLAVLGLGIKGFDFRQMSTAQPKTEKTYETTTEIDTLRIDDSNCNVIVKQGNSNFIKVAYAENEDEYYNISEESGTLTIDKVVTYKWYDNLFSFEVQQFDLVVELPKDYDGEIDLGTSNARIDVEECNFADATFDNSNGRIEADDLSISGTLEIGTSNAKVILSNIEVEEKLTITNSNGGIEATGLTAKEGNISTSNGHIELDGLQADAIDLHNSNGKIIANNIEVADIYAKSSNAGITLDNVTTNTVDTDNSNGRIELHSISADEISADTSNATILLDAVKVEEKIECENSNGKIEGEVIGSYDDFTIQSDTSNASSTLPSHKEGGDITMKMSTSNASIDVEIVEE